MRLLALPHDHLQVHVVIISGSTVKPLEGGHDRDYYCVSALGRCVYFRGFQYITSRCGNVCLNCEATVSELSLGVWGVHKIEQEAISRINNAKIQFSARQSCVRGGGAST